MRSSSARLGHATVVTRRVAPQVRVIPGATKEQLQEAWKEWITEVTG